MLQGNNTCQVLCTVNDVSADDARFINDRIREDYALNWLVDGLPAAEMKVDLKTETIFYDMGFNLGNDDPPRFSEHPALNNHYDITLQYHKVDATHFRIVGVLVWPASMGGSQAVVPTSCGATEAIEPLVLDETHSQAVRYTYKVTWSESATPWATRWDNYLHIFDPRIHWFSLVNAIIVSVFLCAMVFAILYRSVVKDVSFLPHPPFGSYPADCAIQLHRPRRTCLSLEKTCRLMFDRKRCPRTMGGSWFMARFSAPPSTPWRLRLWWATARRCVPWWASHSSLRCSDSCRLQIVAHLQL